MNFNYRSMDNRPSNYSFSPPNLPASNSYTTSYFNHEPIRAGINGAESSRREYFRNPNPNEIRESFQRELEKERIRAEIIAEEVYRRRILEEEVRRELMMERQFEARRRGDRGWGVGSTMQFETKVPLLTNFEHRIGVSQTPQRGGGSEMLPFQRDPVVARSEGGNEKVYSLGVRLKEIKELKNPVPETKAMILAKPDETDLKRKASGPLDEATADPSNGLKKPKTQDEWSCALCRITATSEQALNDHLRGKKHKSRENGLNSQKVGFCTGPLPKTVNGSTGKPIKVPGATNVAGSKKQNKKAGGETSLGRVDKAPAQKLGTDEITLSQEKKTSASNKNKEAAPATAANGKSKRKMNFKCEICQVETYSLKVMNSHKNGKRHLAKVNSLSKPDEGISGEMPSPRKDAVTELKVPDMAAAVDKSVVEEDKNLCIDVVKETINETPAQKSTDAETDITVSVEKGKADENKELYITAAEVKTNEFDAEQVESNQEIAVHNVVGVEEENKVKLLEIVGDDHNQAITSN